MSRWGTDMADWYLTAPVKDICAPLSLAPKEDTTPARNNRKDWTADEQERAAILREQGLSYDKIAHIMGRNHSTVYAHLNGKTKEQKVWSEAERVQALNLREDGKSFAEIAAVLGRSPGAVRHAVKSKMAELGMRHA